MGVVSADSHTGSELSEPVREYRENSLTRLVEVMATAFPGRAAAWAPKSSSLGDGKHRYALAHHAYETMRAAAAEERADLLRAADALWRLVAAGELPAATSTSAGPVVVTDHTRALRLDGIGDMPVWTVNDDGAATANERAGGLVADAVDVAVDAGYDWLLRRSLSIVVLLHGRQPDESTSSWTVSRLPCTLYTDYYDLGGLFAKDLVHESAHSWLNDCIAVEGESLDGDAIYWSPWKRRDRTAFGIIHSSFAFSCVTNLLVALRESTADPVVAAYCDSRITDERARMVEARPGIEAALRTVRSEPIRAMVATELVAAIGPAA